MVLLLDEWNLNATDYQKESGDIRMIRGFRRANTPHAMFERQKGSRMADPIFLVGKSLLVQTIKKTVLKSGESAAGPDILRITYYR
jgi:hypothetical protein